MSCLRIAGALLLLCMGAAGVEAQTVASSFDELGVFVKPGDKISVVDVSGKRVNGRVGKLSRDALTLMTESGARHLLESDVALVRQRRDDSLWNGAVIGAAAGGGYFATLMIIFHNYSDGGDVIVPTMIAGGAMIVGMGAAAGVGLDALIRRSHVIYRKNGSGTKVSVAPLFGSGRRGAAVSVRF